MNTKQLEERVKSIGEERMRLSYDSEVITTVEKIKNMTAQLIDICEDLKRFDELFAKSELPLDCDKDFVNDLLLQIRHLK